MSKKILITLFITMIIVAFAAGAWWYFKTDNMTENTPGNGSPFGENAGGENGFADGGEGAGFTNNGGVPENGTFGKTLPILYQLHKSAVAGLVPFTKKDGDAEKKLVRYIEKGLGHIYETDLEDLSETRISNETRTKIYDAVWGIDGGSVVIRYLDDVEENIRSFLIKLSASAQNVGATKYEESEGLFLPENISSISRSDYDPDKIFYILNKNWSSSGIIYDTGNEKMSQVFQSEITEWSPQWYGKNDIALTTKPSTLTPGYLYYLNTDTERLSKIIGGINGLTTLVSQNGENVLYSESKNNKIVLHLFNAIDKSARTMPVNTLPEKCVWGESGIYVYCAVPEVMPSGKLPDEWYQGIVSFDDAIWKINVESETSERLFVLSTPSGYGIDAISLTLNEDGSALFFINKKDGTPWRMLLENDVDGGQGASAVSSPGI